MKATTKKENYNHSGLNSVTVLFAVLAAGFILYNVCNVIFATY